MKIYISLLLFACTVSISAQHSLDTIYANDKKNVALFFPKPIRQGITGASHFVFTYNREKEQYFGLLQAKPGTESNLLALTSDGQVYSYILKYAESLSKLNYFIDSVSSIGNEKRTILKQLPVVVKDTDRMNRATYFKKYSAYLVGRKSDKLAVVRKKGMKLRLLNMRYDHSEVYLVLDVENGSGIDFEVDYVKVFSMSGNQKRKASYQRLEQSVVYGYKVPAVVSEGSSSRFVLVLPKFVLGTNEKLQFELNERNGNRQLSLSYKR